MKQLYLRLLALVILLGSGSALFALDQATMLAGDAREYVLSWQVIGLGGGVSTGGAYSLNSTVAQPSADELTGGDYTLGGGFWGGGARVVAAVTPTPTSAATATATPGAPTATATPDPPVGGDDVQLYLPLVAR